MKRLAAIWLLLCLVLCGCNSGYEPEYVPETIVSEVMTSVEETTTVSETETTEEETKIPESGTTAVLPDETTQVTAQTYPEPEDETLPASVEKDGSYTTPEDVAEYIHNFGTLPGNFITKKEAQNLGWVSSEGNLWEVAPGMSIGGDYFGNYEGLLPEGKYHECDVNYAGGFRGSERIIYGEDGSIWYTNDHYQSFEQLY